MNLSIPERRALANSALGLALLGAAGAFLGYANPVAQIPPLALLAPASMAMLAVLLHTYASAFFYGWLCSCLGHAACLYWLAVPLHDYGALPWILTLPCILALSAYLGVYGGLFCMIMRLFRQHLSSPAAALLAAPLWAGLEMARGWIGTGFPWLSLATSFVPWPVWIQGAAVFGSYGLSGIYASAAAFLTLAAPVRVIHPYAGKPARRAFRLAMFCCAALPLLAAYGYGLRALQTPPEQGRTLRVALAQGNINQDQKWEPRYQQGTLDRYLALSERALDPRMGTGAAPADIVIWPETSMPFYFEDNQPLRKQLTAFAEKFTTAIAFGAPGKGSSPSGKTSYHNRLWLFNPTAFSLQSYDKEHLVPFGEYIPLSLPLGFIEYFVQGMDFTPGRLGNLLHIGETALGPLICYEAIFPEIARKRVHNGANILVNVSNDAWFGRTAAPVQHLHLTSMRAVEQGRYIARATNTGISAIIDNTGITRFRGGLFRAETIIGEARLLHHHTVYYHVANYITAACIFLPLAAALLCLHRKRRGIR